LRAKRGKAGKAEFQPANPIDSQETPADQSTPQGQEMPCEGPFAFRSGLQSPELLQPSEGPFTTIAIGQLPCSVLRFGSQGKPPPRVG